MTKKIPFENNDEFLRLLFADEADSVNESSRPDVRVSEPIDVSKFNADMRSLDLPEWWIQGKAFPENFDASAALSEKTEKDDLSNVTLFKKDQNNKGPGRQDIHSRRVTEQPSLRRMERAAASSKRGKSQKPQKPIQPYDRIWIDGIECTVLHSVLDERIYMEGVLAREATFLVLGSERWPLKRVDAEGDVVRYEIVGMTLG